MIDPAALPPSDDDDDFGDPAEARRQHELAGLETLADWAMELAGKFRAKALALTDSAQSEKDLAAAQGFGRSFDRAARTYRQCLALKDRLLNSQIARKARAAALDEPQGRPIGIIQAYPALTPQEAYPRRAPVREALTGVIQALRRPRAEREALLADLNEFCDDPEAELFQWGTIGNVIQRYCWAEKLPFDLDRFADTDWARQEIKAQQNDSPYFGYRPKGEAEKEPAAKGRFIADPMARPP